jgi:pimeloyl-ACP methyl ester carboxylesterase
MTVSLRWRVARVLPALLLLAACSSADRATAPRTGPEFDISKAGALSTAPLIIHIIAPQATDPAIDQALDNHYVYLDTAARSNHQLLVFMPGATFKPAFYQLIQAFAARLGYHVIGLMYQDGVVLANVCQTPPLPDAACWENARLEMFDGIHRSTVVTVSPANSQKNRLTKLLQYLAVHYPDEGWSRYLDEDGQPRWSRIVVGGHSQGGGQAALIAKLYRVARVAMFSAPVDGTPGSQGMPWLATHVTPSSRYYALAHKLEVQSAAEQANWDTLGLAAFGPIVQPETSTPPYDFTQTLLTDLKPQGGYTPANAHGSTAWDAQTPLAVDGTPLLSDAWRYVLTGRGHDEGGRGAPEVDKR